MKEENKSLKDLMHELNQDGEKLLALAISDSNGGLSMFEKMDDKKAILFKDCMAFVRKTEIMLEKCAEVEDETYKAIKDLKNDMNEIKKHNESLLREMNGYKEAKKKTEDK